MAFASPVIRGVFRVKCKFIHKADYIHKYNIIYYYYIYIFNVVRARVVFVETTSNNIINYKKYVTKRIWRAIHCDVFGSVVADCGTLPKKKLKPIPHLTHSIVCLSHRRGRYD